VTAEIIQNEERDIDIHRRIAIIEAFGSGKKELILSLCREFAFGTAHSIAGWQGTSDETYHESWREYEYNQYDDDDDDDDEDEDEQHNDSDNDSDEDDNDHDDDVDNDGAATECDEMNNPADDEKLIDCGGGVRNQSHLVTTVNVVVPPSSHPCEDRVRRYDLNERDRFLSDARDLLKQDVEKLLAFQPSTRDQLLKHMLIGLAYSLVYYVFFTIVTNIKL
jgi:cobalamin biosynthesis protein CobT